MLIANTTVDLYRLQKSGYADTYPVTPTQAGLSVGIHPASPELLVLYPSSQYAQFQIFTESSVEIRTGDKFRAADGKEWIVRGVPERYEGLGLDYQWCMAEQVPA